MSGFLRFCGPEDALAVAAAEEAAAALPVEAPVVEEANIMHKIVDEAKL